MFEENGMFDKFALAVWQKVTGIDTTCLNWPRIESDWEEIAVQPFYFSPEYIFCQTSRYLQATHSLTVSLGRLAGMLVSPLLEQSMEEPRHTQGSGQPRAPATSTSTSRQPRLGSMARIVTGSHLQVSAAVTGHMVTVLATVTTGAHMVSLGVGVHCHASLLTAASRLSLYRAGAAARGRGRCPQCRHPPSVQPGTG